MNRPAATQPDTIHPIAAEITEALRRHQQAQLAGRAISLPPVQEVVDQAFRNYWLTQMQESNRR